MTKCTQCDNKLKKGNKSGLCKIHYQQSRKKSKDTVEENVESISNLLTNENDIPINIITDEQLLNDENMIAFIKNSMMKEKLWYDDMKTILMEQITHLKSELASKDKIIDLLLKERKGSHSRTSSHHNTSVESEDAKRNITTSDKDNVNNAQFYTKLQWQQESDVELSSDCATSSSSDMSDEEDKVSTNHRKIVSNDDEFEVPKKIKQKINKQTTQRKETSISKRPYVVTQLNPENNDPQKYVRNVPGNSNYASIVESGKKVCLLSDSMCGPIKMAELNKHLKNAKAYKEYHPGETTKQLTHYALLTLEEEKPDIVIIHVGTNDIGNRNPNKPKLGPDEIATQILISTK